MSDEHHKGNALGNSTDSDVPESPKAFESVILRGASMLYAAQRQFANLIDHVTIEFGPQIAALAKIDWVEAKRRVEELPQKSRVAMNLVATQGWFFGWNDSLETVMRLIAEIEGTSGRDADAMMAAYYRENLEFLSEDLISRNPHRATVIKAAVNAHRTGGTDGFLLAIPVFIAQADGILTELTQVRSAFMRVRTPDRELEGAKALREWLAADQLSLDLVDPLLRLHESDFMKSADARREAASNAEGGFSALNRHQVMHGESWNYGTEINSLKAFSLLSFIGAHLPSVLNIERPFQADFNT